jgi:hypothetical protein
LTNLEVVVSKLNGASSSGMAVTVVETPVWRSYARKSQIAFWVTTAIVGVVTAAVLSKVMHPTLVGVFAGIVAGAATGVLVALLVAGWPLLRVLWHWAVEIVVGLGVVGGARALADLVPPAVAVVLVLVVITGPFAIPPLRRWVLAWVWCRIVRHRLRVCFTEVIRTQHRLRPGHPPLILHSKPTPAGERVWIWLRPGLDLTDLEERTGKLAVACWASEVRAIRASQRFAALIRLDVTRRDPLTGTVPSVLARAVPARRSDVDVPVSPAVVPLGLDLTDIEPTASVPGRGRRAPQAPKQLPGPVVINDAGTTLGAWLTPAEWDNWTRED